MNLTEKAAHEAAENILESAKFMGNHGLNVPDLQRIITKHLAPLQAELDTRAEPDPNGPLGARLNYWKMRSDENNEQIAALQTELDRLKPYETAIVEACMLIECGDTSDPVKALNHLICFEVGLYRDELDRKDAENKALRQIVADSVNALGNGSGCSTEASLEFMQKVPKEISLVVDRKDKLLGEARRLLQYYAGPVDESGHSELKDWLARSTKE